MGIAEWILILVFLVSVSGAGYIIIKELKKTANNTNVGLLLILSWFVSFIIFPAFFDTATNHGFEKEVKEIPQHELEFEKTRSRVLVGYHDATRIFNSNKKYKSLNDTMDFYVVRRWNLWGTQIDNKIRLKSELD